MKTLNQKQIGTTERTYLKHSENNSMDIYLPIINCAYTWNKTWSQNSNNNWMEIKRTICSSEKKQFKNKI